MIDRPLPSQATADVETGDRRGRQLALLLRAIAFTAAIIGAVEMFAGLVFGDPRTAGIGFAAVLFGAWLHQLSRRRDRLTDEQTVTRVASVTLGLIALAAVAQPTVAIGMAIAALIPGVLVLPFLSSSAVKRVLTVAGAVGIGSVVAWHVVPPSQLIPEQISGVLGFVVILVAYGFLLLFLFEVSRRLKTTTDDLRAVVAMSNDLSRTMDPNLVGDRIVRHIAQAVGASESALCYWDRATDRLVTMGCYPPERAASIDPWYALADFPATRRVLDSATPLIVDSGDPDADPSEVAYLASIGLNSMVMVPLIAAGQAVGTLELMSEHSGAFGRRDVDTATMLAGEAAMALENARLYEEIKRQALHDGLTGLANRALFRDRVEHAIERSRDREGRPFAILFIDLDDFKRLNDTLGHARGDEILVIAARRVADTLRPGDTAARLGGDEFAALLDGVEDEATALAVAARVAEALREPMELDGVVALASASIGVATSGGGGETADDLLRIADVAMYAAKGSARGRARIHQVDLPVDDRASASFGGGDAVVGGDAFVGTPLRATLGLVPGE